VLLCHTYNGSCYCMCISAIKQWKRILTPKTCYDTMKLDMMVERSNPIHYKIVRFSKPKFCLHAKELYMFHCIKAELFDSKNWRWKLLDEVKLLREESLHRITKVSMNSSLHWLTWMRNLFAFDVKKKSYCLFPLPPPVFESNNSKDIELVEYKKNVIMTCIDKKNNFMEVWIMEDYNGK